MILITIPSRIVSEANRREHWAAVAQRKRAHRAVACVLLKQRGQAPTNPWRVRVTLTRIAHRELDDDNLASGFKATRDGVADWLGIDDGDPRISWRYAQESGAYGKYSATIKVEWDEAWPTPTQ